MSAKGGSNPNELKLKSTVEATPGGKAGPLDGGVTPLKPKSCDGNFLKYLEPPPMGPRELDFYKTVFNPKYDSSDQTIVRLRGLIPAYYGTTTTKFGNKDYEYLKLEDLVKRFERPCLLEIIMAPPPGEDKAKLGFYLKAMNVHVKSKKQPETWKQSDYKPAGFGLTLDKNGVNDNLKMFLNCDCGVDGFLIRAFIQRLKQVQILVEKQKRFKLDNTNLVLIYDATAHGLGNLSKTPEPQQDMDAMLEMTEVRMIEFCGVTEGDSKNTEYLTAIKNLITIFNEIANQK